MEHVLDSLGWLLKEVDSSFLIYLTMLPWLPTEAVWPPGSTLPSFGRACDLYLRVSNLRRLLGCHAAYLALEMSANSMLAGDLSEREGTGGERCVQSMGGRGRREEERGA
ncbi:uncharacterized protein LOC144737737 [Lampetra planeri]